MKLQLNYTQVLILVKNCSVSKRRANGPIREVFWIHNIALIMVLPSSEMTICSQKEKKKIC